MNSDDRSEEERLNDDERRAHDELHRAQRAKQIIEDEFFVAAVEAIRKKLLDGFAKSRIEDDEIRRQARVGLSILDAILDDLGRHIETGKLASATLQDVKRKRDWLARLKARVA